MGENENPIEDHEELTPAWIQSLTNSITQAMGEAIATLPKPPTAAEIAEAIKGVLPSGEGVDQKEVKTKAETSSISEADIETIVKRLLEANKTEVKPETIQAKRPFLYKNTRRASGVDLEK